VNKSTTVAAALGLEAGSSSQLGRHAVSENLEKKRKKKTMIRMESSKGQLFFYFIHLSIECDVDHVEPLLGTLLCALSV
jgi:hypothetical protein